MRTTLDLADDAYQIAKTVAREQNRSLGSVVSDFITGQMGVQPMSPEPEKKTFYPTFRTSRRMTSEDVKALEDDE